MCSVRTLLLLTATALVVEVRAFLPAAPKLPLKPSAAAAALSRKSPGSAKAIRPWLTAVSSGAAGPDAAGGVEGKNDPKSRDMMRTEALSLAAKVFENDDRPVILYDGVCNLCNGGVNFMLDYDKPDDLRGTFRFAALQSDVGRALLQRGGREPDDLSSIVLATREGSTFTESDAILRIGQGLGGGTAFEQLAPAVSTLGLNFVPRIVRDAVYKVVSENRYRFFGQNDQCRLYDDRFDERFLGEL
jgi:predicted DCC family thiol-disulfide oxidoreductase YuxK